MSEIDMLQTNKLIPVRRLGVLQDRQNYFLRNWKSFQILKPAYCDDNEKIPNSPNQRYQTVEDEEYDLDLLNIKFFYIMAHKKRWLASIINQPLYNKNGKIGPDE